MKVKYNRVLIVLNWTRLDDHTISKSLPFQVSLKLILVIKLVLFKNFRRLLAFLLIHQTFLGDCEMCY